MAWHSSFLFFHVCYAPRIGARHSAGFPLRINPLGSGVTAFTDGMEEHLGKAGFRQFMGALGQAGYAGASVWRGKLVEALQGPARG
jgi:hypothetical protein